MIFNRFSAWSMCPFEAAHCPAAGGPCAVPCHGADLPLASPLVPKECGKVACLMYFNIKPKEFSLTILFT